MSLLRKVFIWYCMLTKRLYKHFSFVVLLLLIPAVIPAAKYMLADNGSVMNVALASEDEDGLSHSIMENICLKDSIIKFTVFDTCDMAREAVVTGKADAAWIFRKDFESKVKRYASGEYSKPLVTVLCQKDTVFQKISRELLYGEMYESLSYETYRFYVTENISGVSENEIAENFIYDSSDMPIIEMQKLGDSETGKSDGGFLVLPLRGMMALVVMLCGFAAVMYFLKDQCDGKYDWMNNSSRIIPAFGMIFSAVLSAGVVVFAAMYLSGIATSFFDELLLMILYVFTTSVFCLLLASVVKTSGIIAGIIPFFSIITLALCPVFFNVKHFGAVKHLLPAYYYMMSLDNLDYVKYSFVYLFVLGLCIVIYRFFDNKIKR